MAVPMGIESAVWQSGSAWTEEDNAFSRSFSIRRSDIEDDEEALKWAALEKLPTYDRLRKSILNEIGETGSSRYKQVDVARLSNDTRRKFIQRLLPVPEEDNEQFLIRLRQRRERVGIEMPKIEVRFEHLNVDADVYVGSRALPTVVNFPVNTIEGFLNYLNLLRSRRRTLTILHDVSGIIKPSRLTLLLGPPGAGKTTLLTTLAGEADRDLRVTGNVTYNGHPFTEFVPQRTSAYISQLDVHYGEMTVRETFDFSGRCQGVGERYELLEEISRREKEAGIKPDPDVDVYMKETAIEGQKTSLVTDYILKILGLDICADTIVGNQMQRGISGGQKKRVTTGEMLVARPKALFMDEISTGLDSATTFQIIKCLRQVVHLLDGTMFISLLQPAPETYELFDDIILLSEGEVVYQGPREYVLDFFESMGFRCPNRKGVADFLQEVTSTKDQEQYWADRSKPYHYIPVSAFAEAFRSFHIGEQLAEEFSHPYDKTKSHPAALTTAKYGVSKWNISKACFSREILLMQRNSFVYIFKTVQIFIVGIVTMTMFFRTKMPRRNINDGNIYMGALFYGVIHVMFNGIAELTMTVARLPVFYKQRDLLFYPAWAFSLPTFVVKIPLSVVEAAIWVFLTYYVIGFAPDPRRGKQQDLLNVLGSMYCSVLFLGVSNSSTVQPVVEVERTVFYREKAAGMYSALPYAFAQVAIEVPYILIQSIVYVALVYSMISFEWTPVKFFWFFFFMYFTFLYYTLFGMLTVAVTPNSHVSAIISSALYSTWNLFCGFIIPRPRMPVWWRWYYWANPVSWTLYGLVASQLADVQTEMDTADGRQVVSRFVKSYFGMRHDFLGVVAAVMVCIPFVFALMFAFAIKLFNFQKR